MATEIGADVEEVEASQADNSSFNARESLSMDKSSRAPAVRPTVHEDTTIDHNDKVCDHHGIGMLNPDWFDVKKAVASIVTATRANSAAKDNFSDILALGFKLYWAL